MIPYKGDFRLGDVVEHYFASNDGAASITLATNGTLRLYKAGSTTELSTVVTLAEDFDGLTGVHRVSLQLSGAGITPGADYVVVLVGAVVSGATINTPLFSFSVQNRGTWVVSRGQLAAVTANGGQFAAGTFDRVNVGDRVRIVSTARADYRLIDSLNTGTGDFTLRGTWGQTPSVGDYYEVHEGVQGDQLAATDIADGALTEPKFAAAALTADKFDSTAIAAIQAGLATDAALSTVDGVVDSILAGQANLATAAALAAIDSDTTALLSNQATLLADLSDVQARLPAALVGGKIDASLSASGLQADALLEIVSENFAKELFAGFSFERVMKIIFAGVAGPSQDVDTGSPKFKSPDGASVLVDATASAGNRTINSYGA